MARASKSTSASPRMSAKLANRAAIPQDDLAALCRRYHVRELSLFGSVLRDDFRDDSDIDVLVEFEPDAPIGFIAYQELQDELASLLDRPVDVVPKLGLNSVIRHDVLKSSQVVYPGASV